jgi:hypothetical protein
LSLSFLFLFSRISSSSHVFKHIILSAVFTIYLKSGNLSVLHTYYVTVVCYHSENQSNYLPKQHNWVFSLMENVNVYSAVRVEFSPELCVVGFIVKNLQHGLQNVSLDISFSRYVRPSNG